MRIGVDGYNLAMPHGTGVATYGVELVEALRRLEHRVEGVFGLAVPADASLREAALFDALKRDVDPKRRAKRYQRMRHLLRAIRGRKPREVPLTDRVEKSSFAGTMPIFDRMTTAAHVFEDAFAEFKLTGRFISLHLPDPPEVMHWTYPVPIAIENSRNVYTLHDLVPLKLPYTTLDNKRLYGRVAAHCVATAAQICTVSESSKRDIVEQFNIDPARVTNTYQTTAPPAATLRRSATEDAHAVEGIFGLRHRSYFLYFGAIEPKKNVGRLIEAYLALQTTTPLVIVGARSWQGEQQLMLMPGGGASGAAGTYVGQRGQTIIRLDYLPRDLLAKLIRGSKAVVFPSLYEGFGLPVLEAMQLGAPVITSSTSSLPEVAGDAGLLVDPYDVSALMEAMRRLDGDEELAQGMAARGLEQAKLFSRERYQRRLTELYRAAMASR